MPTPKERPIKELRLKGPIGAVTVGLGTFVLGRGATADVRLDVPELSRVHAVLSVSSVSATVADHNSVNGTFVNGVEVTEAQDLHDGDRVMFGAAEFVVELVR